MWECNLIGIWVKINKYAYKTPTYTEWLLCNIKGKTFYQCKDTERQWGCLIGRQKPGMFLHALRKAACGITEFLFVAVELTFVIGIQNFRGEFYFDLYMWKWKEWNKINVIFFIPWLRFKNEDTFHIVNWDL